jgi:hypothetical protein
MLKYVFEHTSYKVQIYVPDFLYAEIVFLFNQNFSFLLSSAIIPIFFFNNFV